MSYGARRSPVHSGAELREYANCNQRFEGAYSCLVSAVLVGARLGSRSAVETRHLNIPYTTRRVYVQMGLWVVENIRKARSYR